MSVLFRPFRQSLIEHFNKMSDVSALFEVDVDKDVLWNLYLDSFPEGTNEIFRERREHDCQSCRAFIKALGNVVQIKDNKVVTLWDFEAGEYQPVVDALSSYIKSRPVVDVWVNKQRVVGTDATFENKDGNVRTWEHFYVNVPTSLVTLESESESTIRVELGSRHGVFERSLRELSEESVLTVLELISQNSLYKGEEWESPLRAFLSHKQAYSALSEADKVNYAWEQSVKVGPVVGRIRNHSIGTLLIDLSEGMELDEAVRRYEAIVAPTNYKRPKPIFTQRMLDEARAKVEELGYGNSLKRRFATLDDITVNNILFSNRDSVKRMVTSDVFDEMANHVAVQPKQFSRVEEIGLKEFVEDVLPIATELEILLESKHAGNMVSLIAPQDMTAPSMFKWNNGFGWAYAGNITDSMKERVKAAGGKVDGVLRFSIQWNDGTEHDPNDLDAHCIEPGGNEIYFGSKSSWKTGGMLDVDIINPSLGVPAVENITWSDASRLSRGKYSFYVHGFSARRGKGGFRAEIEFDGQIYSFDYSSAVRQGESVFVADVVYNGSEFTIKELLPSQLSSRDLWGVKTNQFVPASVVMYSPNYWDAQYGIGHRHVFFMLKGCVNPERPNGFFNEYLKEDLLKYKHVFEALGSRLAVEDSQDQLSGVGFSTTKRNTVVVKVKGQVERVLKVLI